EARKSASVFLSRGSTSTTFVVLSGGSAADPHLTMRSTQQALDKQRTQSPSWRRRYYDEELQTRPCGPSPEYSRRRASPPFPDNPAACARSFAFGLPRSCLGFRQFLPPFVRLVFLVPVVVETDQ